MLLQANPAWHWAKSISVHTGDIKYSVMCSLALYLCYFQKERWVKWWERCYKSFPLKGGQPEKALAFFFFSIQVLSFFFPLVFNPFVVISGFLKTPPSCTKASFSTVWNHFIMLLMWILRDAVSPRHQDTQSTTTVLLNPVWFRI